MTVRGIISKPVRHCCNDRNLSLLPQQIQVMIDQIDDLACIRFTFAAPTGPIGYSQILNRMWHCYLVNTEETHGDSTPIRGGGEQVLATRIIDVTTSLFGWLFTAVTGKVL